MNLEKANAFLRIGKNYFFTTLLLLTIAAINAKAQYEQNASEKRSGNNSEAAHQMNFLKVNLMGIAARNYSFQYERIITRKFSLAASYRFMPTGKVPFTNFITFDNEDDKQTVENIKMGDYAITPEARFYLGKGYGKGFYISLFYRYSNYTGENILVKYDDTRSINFNGKLTANTGGIMFGAQWPLGKHVCLDWWIIGPHYGSGNGNLNGLSSQPLSQVEQDELRKNLEDLSIPFTNKTVVVTANGAVVKLDGPWAGVRTGLCIGVKF